MAWLTGYTYRKKITATGTTDASGWVSPTGFVDPDTAWTNYGNAYDGDTGSGSSTAVAANSWSSYLELTHASMYCDKVRFYAYYLVTTIDEISVDVYYSAGWHNIYEGAFANQTWVEKAIGSTQQVTAARVKFYNEHDADPYSPFLYEFEFNEVRTLTNYQLALDVNYGAGSDSGLSVFCNSLCDTDFDDIRFTSSDGSTEIDYWREEYTGSDDATFWVEFDSILPTATNYFYMYYGKTGDSTTSNIENTMVKGDDGVSGSFDEDTSGDAALSYSGGKKIITEDSTDDAFAVGHIWDAWSYYSVIREYGEVTQGRTMFGLFDEDVLADLCAATATAGPKRRFYIERYGTGEEAENKSVMIHYFDTGSVERTWDGTAWQTTGNPFETSGNLELRIWTDGTNLLADVLSNGTSVFTNPATIAISSVKTFSAGKCLAWVELYTNAYTSSQSIDNYFTRNYTLTQPTLAWSTREAQFIFDASVLIGNLVSTTRSHGIVRSALVLIGNQVSATRSHGIIRAASVLIGVLVSATRVHGVVRSAVVLIGNKVTATRALAYKRTATVLIGNKVSTTISHGVIRTASVLIGNLVSATHSSGIIRTASVLIGNLVSATHSSGIIRTATVLIGNLVSTTRIHGVVRSATILIGNLVSTTRIHGVVRSATILIGNLVSAERIHGILRTASVLIGNKVTATRALAYKRTATVLIGNKVSTTISHGVIRTASVLIGNLVSATHSSGIIRTATVLIGNLVSTTRIHGVVRSATILIGNLVSAERIHGILRTASVLIGNKVTATRALAYKRTATVLIGNKVSTTISHGVIRTASVLIGNLVSATHSSGIIRTATVLIGNLVSAERIHGILRTASVLIGNKVSATRAMAYVRTASVLIGNKVSATYSHGYAGIRAAVIIGVVATATVCVRLKELIRVPIDALDAARLTIARLDTKRLTQARQDFWRRIRRCE